MQESSTNASIFNMINHAKIIQLHSTDLTLSETMTKRRHVILTINRHTVISSACGQINITFPDNDDTWWFSSEMNIRRLSSGCMNIHNVPSWEHARIKSTSYFMKFCLFIVSKNPLFIKWIRSCTNQSFSCWLSCSNAWSKMACKQYLLLTLTLDWNISWRIHFKS